MLYRLDYRYNECIYMYILTKKSILHARLLEPGIKNVVAYAPGTWIIDPEYGAPHPKSDPLLLWKPSNPRKKAAPWSF